MPGGSASTEDEPVHDVDPGTGQPVVLTRGWPLSGRSWEEQVPVLVETRYRAIAYESPRLRRLEPALGGLRPRHLRRRPRGAATRARGRDPRRLLDQDAVHLASWASPKGTRAASPRSVAPTSVRNCRRSASRPSSSTATPTRSCRSRRAAGGPAEPIEGAKPRVIDGSPHRMNVSHAAEFDEALIAFLKG